jgi:hypothetical protein
LNRLPTCITFATHCRASGWYSTLHASGKSVRAIAAEFGVSKSVVANIVSRGFIQEN